MRGTCPKQKTVLLALVGNLCNATGLPGGCLRWLLGVISLVRAVRRQF
jgi:hypothetical protein